MALLWPQVDLASGVINVERNWDMHDGMIDLKSHAGRRKVPISAVLRDYLDEHRLRSGGEGHVFGGHSPFYPRRLSERADKAWEAAGLNRITLHECRHSFASLMIAAGVNAKALSTYMGHANIGITLDTYGHLMPGNEEEAAGLLDAYLERADTQARLAAVESHGTKMGQRVSHKTGRDGATRV
jgi:integrase